MIEVIVILTIAIVFLILLVVPSSTCFSREPPYDSKRVLEGFDEWYYSKYPEKRPSASIESIDHDEPYDSEQVLKEFDEWFYSKYPEKHTSENTESIYPDESYDSEQPLDEFDEWYHSEYGEKKPPKNLSPKSRTYIDPNGYRRYSDSRRLVHIHVAEIFVVERKLRRYEVVHHINVNKLDNRPDNLRVMTWKEHKRLHRR